VSVNIRTKIAKLDRIHRMKVQSRAAELIADEMSLRDLRKARKLTQARVAKVLGVTQDSVSRLEKRSDLLLSTLRKTVKAMGGDVRIVAEFRDRPPVVLSDLSEEARPRKSAQKRAQVLRKRRLSVGR
jgi:transcriptional regulator with XRE-family HTH domain